MLSKHVQWFGKHHDFPLCALLSSARRSVHHHPVTDIFISKWQSFPIPPFKTQLDRCMSVWSSSLDHQMEPLIMVTIAETHPVALSCEANALCVLGSNIRSVTEAPRGGGSKCTRASCNYRESIEMTRWLKTVTQNVGTGTGNCMYQSTDPIFSTRTEKIHWTSSHDIRFSRPRFESRTGGTCRLCL